MIKPNLVELDRHHLIHPVSSFRGHEKKGVTILKSAQGVWLTDIDDNLLLDAFSGLWCVNTGYGQQSVIAAVQEQISKLPYATAYFGFGSQPAIELAARLVELTPKSLQHVYFTGGGSDSVDAAIRYITYYYNAIGQPKRKHFIALHSGYHGSSSQGSGLTGLPVFHANFDVPLLTQHHIPCPNPYRSDVGTDDTAIIAESVRCLKQKVLDIGREQVAAFFCEPIMGSGGVIMPPKGWLKAMEQTCRELDILFVVDEVITGFGRTGPMFACEDEDVQPDLMTMAKGLTAGYVPMGAVMMSDIVYDGIADGPHRSAIVGHGNTYSGHPVAAAAALAVLKLYEEGGLLENAQSLSPYFKQKLEACMSHPLVGNVRSRGFLAAIELVADKTTKKSFTSELALGEIISKVAYKHGVVFRAFPNGILGFAPALCFSKQDFDFLFERLNIVLDEVYALDVVQQALGCQ
jgi:4-aminobutyrate---pyruvate transaminase